MGSDGGWQLGMPHRRGKGEGAERGVISGLMSLRRRREGAPEHLGQEPFSPKTKEAAPRVGGPGEAGKEAAGRVCGPSRGQAVGTAGRAATVLRSREVVAGGRTPTRPGPRGPRL